MLKVQFGFQIFLEGGKGESPRLNEKNIVIYNPCDLKRAWPPSPNTTIDL